VKLHYVRMWTRRITHTAGDSAPLTGLEAPCLTGPLPTGVKSSADAGAANFEPPGL
jgi:hypothetical protein